MHGHHGGGHGHGHRLLGAALIAHLVPRHWIKKLPGTLLFWGGLFLLWFWLGTALFLLCTVLPFAIWCQLYIGWKGGHWTKIPAVQAWRMAGEDAKRRP